MSSLRKQLEELTNPTPALADLEDEDFDGTSSKRIFEKGSDNEDEIESTVRRIRQNVNLEESDFKYRGSKTTRKEIFGESSGFSLSGAKIGKEQESEDEESDNEEEEDLGDEEKALGTGAYELQLWEPIMRLTIKTHAALRVFNQLPRGDTAKNMIKEADSETKENLEKLRTNIFNVVQGFLEVEEVLNKQGASNSLDEDDEEIESSEDEEESGENGVKEEEDIEEEDSDRDEPKSNGIQNGTASKDHSKRLRSFQKTLSSRKKEFSKTVSEVLTKWDDRTKFAGRKSKNSKDLAVLESSAMKQIERVLSDKFRLLRRTQQKRSNDSRIGGNPESSIDPEIFDDDDFYQVLLKEFIEQKNAQTSDPVEMSRQFIELQKLRQNRVKKVVDARGNYDKRIKFVTVPKLVNFYASRPECVEWSHEKRNELFKSLFM
ncbi:hypothetical protein FO519_005997 [Halicephalobus sp. NKZ332]|nr:hypothetical protein FO519_005997 [Halicephalobus sp. NKZ332]